MMHLIFEGQGKEPLDVSTVANYLLESIKVSGMTLILGPQMHQDSGIQGYCILAESHTSIHITKDGYIFGDVFSCLGFEVEPVLNCARKMLTMNIAIHGTLDRGLEFLNPVPLTDGEGIND